MWLGLRIIALGMLCVLPELSFASLYALNLCPELPPSHSVPKEEELGRWAFSSSLAAAWPLLAVGRLLAEGPRFSGSLSKCTFALS